MAITFTLYPEHKNFVPGDSTLKFSAVGPTGLDAIKCLVMSLVLAGGFGLLLQAFYILGIQPQLFATQGAETTGQVISCEMVAVRSGSLPRLTYSYSWNDMLFQSEEMIPGRKQDCTAYLNQTVAVRLLTFDPGTSRLIMMEEAPSLGLAMILLFMSGFVGLLALGCLVIALDYLRARRAYPRLVREGRLLMGEITQISGEQAYRKGTGYSVQVSYQFQSPEGVTIKGSAVHERPDLKGNLPSIRIPVSILYADDHTYVLL